MNMLSFKKVRPWTGVTYWFCGIYKIVVYDNHPDEFAAYYLKDGDMNWGMYVSKPPDRGHVGYACWSTMRSAIQACEEHQRLSQTPTTRQTRRAKLTLAALIEQEANQP